MFVIVEGVAYIVDDTTGKKVTFDVDGQMQIDSSTTISITTQELLSYDEMFKKMNFKKSIDEIRKTYITTNASSDDYGFLIDNVLNAFDGNEELSKKMDDIIYSTVVKIENYLDDVVITFDKNGGTGTMAQVRKEVGDKYKLPACTFTAPEHKRFKEWKIGNTSYDVGDEITLSESITVRAIWENIPQYTLTFDANGGTGTMESVTKYEGEEYTLPASTFTAPDEKEFDQWLIGEDKYDAGDKIIVSEDATIEATWKDVEAEQGQE